MSVVRTSGTPTPPDWWATHYKVSVSEGQKGDMNAGLSTFPTVPEDIFGECRNRVLRLLTYLARNIAQILEVRPSSPATFALFDSSGLLLEIYGNPDMLDVLAGQGIQKRDIWTLEGIGPNAVTQGLAEGRTLASSGKDHAHSTLRKYALYFSPIRLQDATPPFRIIDYGGLVVHQVRK